MRAASLWVSVVVLSAADARAENERRIQFFRLLNEVTAPHDFEYAVAVKGGPSETNATLTIHVDGSGTLSASANGGAAVTATLPVDPKSKRPELLRWKPPAAQAKALIGVDQLVQGALPLQAATWRSSWEDGWETAYTDSYVRFSTEPCTVGERTGRRAVGTKTKDNSVLVEACLSPEVPLPLELTVHRGAASETFTLASYRGPGKVTCPTCWECGSDCGPAPRRPPPAGSPAPALSAARWAPAAPPEAAQLKGKVLLVHACRVTWANDDCKRSIEWINRYASKNPEVVAVTLVPETADVPADQLIGKLGANHAVGIQTGAQRDALDAAADLKQPSTAWIAVDGKVRWYGTYHPGWSQWVAGNRFAHDAKTFGVFDEAIADAVKAVHAPQPTDPAVMNAVKKAAAPIRACFDKEKASHPSLEGKVVVQFTLAWDEQKLWGKAQDPKIVESTLASPLVESCIVEALLAGRFPLPRTWSSSQTVRYPVVFK